MQTIGANSRQRFIVEYDDRIGVVREAFEGEERVVGLDDDVGSGRIRKDGIGLDEFLRVAIVESFEDVGTESGACSSCYRVHEHESLFATRVSLFEIEKRLRVLRESRCLPLLDQPSP